MLNQPPDVCEHLTGADYLDLMTQAGDPTFRIESRLKGCLRVAAELIVQRGQDVSEDEQVSGIEYEPARHLMVGARLIVQLSERARVRQQQAWRSSKPRLTALNPPEGFHGQIEP